MRSIRHSLGVSQRAFAPMVGLHWNTIARMERDVVSIPPTLELLIGYVARDAGLEVAYGQTGSRASSAKKRAERGKARHHGGKGRPRPGSTPLSPRGR